MDKLLGRDTKDAKKKLSEAELKLQQFKEKHSHLAELMAALSEQDQHALRAVDLQGMSQKDYADQLGIDYTTASCPKASIFCDWIR